MTSIHRANDWVVYIIGCDDGVFYTGITTDLQRRWREHSEGGRGAKFFRGRKPLQVLYVESGHDRSSASRREVAIKRLRRAAKEALLAAPDNCAHCWDCVAMASVDSAGAE